MGALVWESWDIRKHTHIHQRSVCSEMLTSAVPEARALWGRQDLGGQGTFQVRECARELVVGGQNSATAQNSGEPRGSGGDKCPHREDQLSGKEIRSRGQWELCGGVRRSQVR